MSSRSIKFLSAIHVLLVDDDRRIANLVKSVLQGLGFQHIHMCHNGEDAIKTLKAQPMDFMICDWQMHPVDGIKLVEFLRNDAESPNKRIPVIMLSGNSEQPQVEYARDKGITEFVVKPFTAKSLCSRIIAIIDHPRSFVQAPEFTGPSRRRKSYAPGEERRKRREK